MLNKYFAILFFSLATTEAVPALLDIPIPNGAPNFISSRIFPSSGEGNAGFVEGIRGFYQFAKNKFLRGGADSDSSSTSSRSPLEAVGAIIPILMELQQKVNIRPNSPFYVDLASMKIDPSTDWGFRIADWYFINKRNKMGPMMRTIIARRNNKNNKNQEEDMEAWLKAGSKSNSQNSVADPWNDINDWISEPKVKNAIPSTTEQPKVFPIAALSPIDLQNPPKTTQLKKDIIETDNVIEATATGSNVDELASINANESIEATTYYYLIKDIEKNMIVDEFANEALAKVVIPEKIYV